MPLRLDLNIPDFQQDLFALGKNERHAALTTLARLSTMEWEEVYAHSGLNWEKIKSLTGPQGQVLYSLRAGQKMRMVGWREGDVLRLLSIHPDHDGAYER